MSILCFIAILNPVYCKPLIFAVLMMEKKKHFVFGEERESTCCGDANLKGFTVFFIPFKQEKGLGMAK